MTNSLEGSNVCSVNMDVEVRTMSFEEPFVLPSLLSNHEELYNLSKGVPLLIKKNA